MNKFYYPAIFEPEETGYSVYVPDIAGCVSQGETLEEAVAMIEEAVGLALEGMPEKDFPKASLPQDIELKNRQFTMLVGFDKLAYEKKYNSRSVKKTLSIPAWLNTLAEEKHLNFSSILQYALKKELRVE